MQIHVEFMALIERPDGIPRKFKKEIDGNIKLKQLLFDLGFDHASIRQMQYFVSSSANKEQSGRVMRSYEFQDNDHLFVTIPIGGG